MNKTIAPAQWTFLLTGIYALVCIPAILLAERFGWSQRPFHLTQGIAVILCFAASLLFLRATRTSRFSGIRWLAVAAVVVCGLWLAFLAYVVATFDLGGMG